MLSAFQALFSRCTDQLIFFIRRYIHSNWWGFKHFLGPFVELKTGSCWLRTAYVENTSKNCHLGIFKMERSKLVSSRSSWKEVHLFEWSRNNLTNQGKCSRSRLVQKIRNHTKKQRMRSNIRQQMTWQIVEWRSSWDGSKKSFLSIDIVIINLTVLSVSEYVE